MAGKGYTGVVVYQDGWHYSVDKDGSPDRRLFLEDDGSYRDATDDDQSWHDRKHQRFATVEMEDGQPGVQVTEDEMDAIRKFLDLRRAGGQ